MERKKTIVALMIVAAVVGCITAAAVAAAPSLKASDIAKAILPGGIINPKAIVPGSITTEHLADGAVNSAKIAPNTITADDIDTGAVTSDEIANYTITESDIGPNAINSTMIIDYTISQSDIGPNAINSTMIIDGQVQESDIAANAVNDTQLKAGAIPIAINHSTATVSVTGTSENEIFNVSLTLNRNASLVIQYTGNDSWVEAKNKSIVNCSIFNKTGAFIAAAYPNNVPFSDPWWVNITRSVTFVTDVITVNNPPLWLNISIRMKSNASGTVGVNGQALVVMALPA